MTVRPGQDSVRRFAAFFGSANVAGLLAQLGWLVLGSRAMPATAFGTVLAAQTVYGLAQYAVDNGTAFHGARLAAAGALDHDTRASIIRIRLELAALGAIAMLGLGAAGGRTFLTAAAPFTLALLLFAVLGYWERFGLGDSRPWAAYLVLRSVLPALAAGVFLLGGEDFPVEVAGLVESGAVVAVALAFSLRPAAQLRLGLAGRRTAWRGAARVALPNLVWQLGVFSGVVLLAATRAAAAAAALAVSVRLLTGVNQLAGIAATSLYPRLAGRPEQDRTTDDRALAHALDAVLLLAVAANAVLLAFPSAVVGIVLGESPPEAERTALITLGGAGAVCLLLLLVMVLIARRDEGLALLPLAAGTGLAVALGTAIVAVSPEEMSTAMAVALAAGQLVGVSLLARRAVTRVPALTRRLVVAVSAAWALALLALLAAAEPTVRMPAAAALAAAASVLVVRARL